MSRIGIFSKLKKKTDFQTGICLAGALFFMLFIYAPLELYFYNQNEFWFDVYDLLPLLAVIFLIGFLAFAAVQTVLYLVSPKLYRICLPIGAITFLCTYVQGNFLVGNLPEMDGRDFDWSDYSEGRIHSIILWVVVTVLVLVVLKLVRMEKFYVGVKMGSLFFTLMLLLTLGSICLTTRGYVQKLDACATIKNEYEFSENKNFIILLLDATDSGTLYEMMQENPEYREIFEDFTYYRNTMGIYPCTMCAVPQILYGERFANETHFDEYNINAYKNSAFLNELENQGYKLGMYEHDMPYLDESIYRFDNVLERKSEVSDYLTWAKLEIKLVGLRYAPFDLKKKCTLKMSGFSTVRESNNESPVFMPDNGVYYGRLQGTEISYTQDNCFKFIHVSGAHLPFEYNKDLEYVENGTYRDVMEASMTITETYLNKLKEAGVYDNSVIIVMADHGLDETRVDSYEGRQNPILFVKGIDEKHEMTISEAPVSYEDLQEAFARLMDGADSSQIFDAKEGDERERKYLFYEYEEEDFMYEYSSVGHAGDDSMLTFTGNEYIR